MGSAPPTSHFPCSSASSKLHRCQCQTQAFVCLLNGSIVDTQSEACLRMQLPKLLELVGLGYSSWFTYRYLLFKVLT